MRTTVSVLLLTFITAVSAGFLVYPWVMSFFNKINITFPQNYLYVKETQIDSSHLKLVLENSGQVPIEVFSVKVNNNPAKDVDLELLPGRSANLTIEGVYSKGNTYLVQIFYKTYTLTNKLEVMVRYD